MAKGYLETDAGGEPLPDRMKTGYHSRLNIRPTSLAEHREIVRRLDEIYNQLKKTNGCETTASPIKDACKGGGTVEDECPPTSAKVEATKEPDSPDIGLKTILINTGDSVLYTGGGTVVDECPPTSTKVEATKEPDPPDIGVKISLINTGDSVLYTGGGTVEDECPPTSAKVEATKEPDSPDIGLKTILINTGDSVLYTVICFCAELNKFVSCAAAKELWVMLSLMIVGCSAVPLTPASCIAPICAFGEPTSVTCQFDRDISASRHGVIVQMFPFNATKDISGKDVLICSWQNNAAKCLVKDGYVFNYNISDRLTLEIPFATSEMTGVYKCHVASEVYPPRPCNLIITERREGTQSPTTTNGTTGKATSTTAQPSETMGLGYSVMVISLGVFAVVAASALIHFLFYKRLKSRFNLAEKNTSGQNMGGTAEEATEILPKNMPTEQQMQEENRSLEQTT